MKKNHVKKVTNFKLSNLSLAVASVFVTLSLTSNAFAQESTLNNNNRSSSNSDSITNVSVKESVKENKPSGMLIQIGENKEENRFLPPLKGWATDLPLIEVLKQITPNGWVVKKGVSSEPLNTQKLVSWKGGKSWVKTLSDLASENSLTIFVNWSKKEISVAPSKLERKIEVNSTSNTINTSNVRNSSSPANEINSKNSGEIFELEETIGMGNSKANQPVEMNNAVNKVLPPRLLNTNTSLPAPVHAPVVVNAWMLEPTKSLKENVIDFGKSVGYKVEWIGEDYPVDEQRPLNGEFDSDNGPIGQLSKDYGPKSRVKQPLSFQFFQNRTLVVENWQFEQQANPQYTQP